jgi:tetratricopeptide (TPR) repeat protein
LILRGSIYEGLGNYSSAISDYNAVLSIDPNNSDVNEMRLSAIKKANIEAARREENRKQALDNLINSLNQLSSTLNTISNSSSSSQGQTSAYSQSGSISSSSNNYQQEYDQQKRIAREQILRLARRKGNDEAYGIAGKEYAPTPNPALNVTILRSLQSSQKLMKEIRERASKHGIFIQKAEEEDFRW